MMDQVMSHSKEFLWKKVKAIILYGVLEEWIVKDFLLSWRYVNTRNHKEQMHRPDSECIVLNICLK